MKRKSIWRSLFLCALCAQFAVSQSKRDGEITGRVLLEDGRPLAGVEISINRIGVKRGAEQTTLSDEEGNFRFANLAPGVYAVGAGMPGFVVEGASRGSNVHRIGEQALIRLTKGGVITGRVTDEAGEPLVGVYVLPQRVRGLEAESPDREARMFGVAGGLTDDRGIYRVYGLPPGVYVVGIGGEQGDGDSSRVGRDAPTYYPSVPRDVAAEVTLHGSEEITSIDIRHRGEPGRVVSGAITGAIESAHPYQRTTVALKSVEEGRFTASTGVQNSRGFAIHGVSEGEYEVRAWRPGDADEAGASSLPKRISVKGADLTGIELKLLKLGAIAGRVTVEPLAKKCEVAARQSFVEEITLRPLRDEAKRDATDQGNPGGWWSESRFGAVPNTAGEFRMNDLGAGRYFLAANLPDENWYIRSISAPAPAAVKRTLAPATKPAAPPPGIVLKSGEMLSGVEVKVAEGAASLRGQIVPANDAVKLPKRMRIHLIPAEAEAAGDVLRYAETIAESAGAFAFKHLAPGKYLLLARPVADRDDDRPAAWDAAERAKLRREAEAAKNEIELQPCSRVKDHVLRVSTL